jgi:hypothetical protein
MGGAMDLTGLLEEWTDTDPQDRAPIFFELCPDAESKVAGVAVIANIAKQVYAAIEFSSIWCDVLPCPTRRQVMVHNALGTIPDLCRFIVPFIIYRSQPLPPVNPASVEAIPSETACWW